MSDRIDQALSTLTDREHKALRMRFGLDDGRSHTLEEVGKEEVGKEEVGKEEVGKEEVGKEEVGKEEVGKEEVGKQFGVTRERIRQIEAKALRGYLE